MSLEISDLVLILVANIVRFYALKHFIDIFLANGECSCDHMGILYGIASLWTVIIYCFFMSPVLNVFSNLIGFFVVVLPMISALVKKAAERDANTCCPYITYQPKLPDAVKKNEKIKILTAIMCLSGGGAFCMA